MAHTPSRSGGSLGGGIAPGPTGIWTIRHLSPEHSRDLEKACAFGLDRGHLLHRSVYLETLGPADILGSALTITFAVASGLRQGQV